MRGDFCVLSSSWTASASHWVRPCFSSAISCDTNGWQGLHPVSKLPLCIVSNSSAPGKSSLHKLHKNLYQTRKMVKSCAAIGCKKRHGSGESFHRFPSSKFRQKQWLASMKLLNPPVLKYAYVCSDHFTDEDFVRNHTLQSGLLQSTVNKVLKRVWVLVK